MATAIDHREKARHNQACLASIDAAQFPDWAVTMAFYAALHLIEAVLVTHNRARPQCTHPIRNGIVQREYSTLWFPYRTLYELSRRSRYDCYRITQGDVWRAMQSACPTRTTDRRSTRSGVIESTCLAASAGVSVSEASASLSDGLLMHDIVLVGAGTAGCVLAERLTASGRLRVLLIEAGG